MSWTIDKQFDFCYGHRVWSQELIGEFCESGDACAKCRHLHGHQGHIHVFLEGDELTRGMVTDFKHLGWMKNFLDDNLDHKFIIDRNDPWFDNIVSGKIVSVPYVVERGQALYPKNGTEQYHAVDVSALAIGGERTLNLIPIYVPGTEMLAGHCLDVKTLSGPEQEFYEGFFIVDFLPTSENLSKYLFDIANAKMSKIGVRVSRVDWFETPKSRSSYIR